MKRDVALKDIMNQTFWINYIGTSYPNSYDESIDQSVSDLMYEMCTPDKLKWWDEFRGYYEGVLDDCDGYVDCPATLTVPLHTDRVLSIEFHPGDTLYFVNGEQVGSTGPHWELQVFAYSEVERLLSCENGEEIFLLLLPLAHIKDEEIEEAKRTIQSVLARYFSPDLCAGIAGCILSGIVDSSD